MNKSSGKNFDNLNLHGQYFVGVDFQGASFKGTNLKKANLKCADLRDTDFKGADLRDADFRGADLTNADFEGADIRGAKFEGAKIRGADFYKAYQFPSQHQPKAESPRKNEDIKNYIELAIDLSTYAIYQRTIDRLQPAIRKLTQFTEDKPNTKKIICLLLDSLVKRINIDDKEFIPD